MRGQGGWKSRGSDRGSSGKVQFKLAKPTHLTAAVRHSYEGSWAESPDSFLCCFMHHTMQHLTKSALLVLSLGFP